MNTREASELGKRIAGLIRAGQPDEAFGLLGPILAERVHFPLLERIGAPIGAAPLPVANVFLERIAFGKTEGGWVVIGSALGQQLDRDPAGVFDRCRKYVIAANVWYTPDILGERVPGPALLADFPKALSLLDLWRQDSNRWVRRTVGVAVHFWAKRSLGKPETSVQAQKLLDFLEPMFEEQDLDAVKGVGWGLKTLGRYYPDLASDWLAQVVQYRKRYRALILRKALTYLPVKQRARIAKAAS